MSGAPATGLRAATDRRWLTLGQASRFVGVDASTLRTWANAGRVPAFRTPGGHRRFARTDMQALLRRSRPPRPKQVASLIQRQGSTLVRRRPIVEAPWYAQLDAAARREVRRTCRALMNALTGYLAGGVRRHIHLQNGERAGRRLGTVLAARGLTPAQAAQAFLHFSGGIGDAVTRRLEAPPEHQVRMLRQVDAFLGRVMVRLMDAWPPTPVTPVT